MADVEAMPTFGAELKVSQLPVNEASPQSHWQHDTTDPWTATGSDKPRKI